jgi:hypothetical protein
LPKLLQTNEIVTKVLLAEEKPNNTNISSGDTPRTTTVGLELPAKKTHSAAIKALSPFGGSNSPSSDDSDIYWPPQDLFQPVDVIHHLFCAAVQNEPYHGCDSTHSNGQYQLFQQPFQ